MSYGYVDSTGKISYYENPLTADENPTGLKAKLALSRQIQNGQQPVDSTYQSYGDLGYMKPYGGLLDQQSSYQAVDPMTQINSKYTQAPQGGNADPLALFQSYKAANPQTRSQMINPTQAQGGK